jgi:hypothetical protein
LKLLFISKKSEIVMAALVAAIYFPEAGGLS